MNEFHESEQHDLIGQSNLDCRDQSEPGKRKREKLLVNANLLRKCMFKSIFPWKIALTGQITLTLCNCC